MSWYTPTGNPLTRASGLSATIRAEFLLIKSAFDSLPSAFGTMAQQDASAVTITGGTIAVSSLTVGGSAAITAASSNTLTNKTMSGASNTFSNIAWSSLVSTPTTVSGYGITNALVTTNDLSDVNSASTARGNLGAAASGAVGSTGITMTTSRLLGRTTASTGAIEEITAGDKLSLSAGSLNVNVATQSDVDAGTSTTKVLTPDLNLVSLKTLTASTSGTSIDFTSIPSGVRRITVSLSGVSTNGSSAFQVQLGVSGTPETSSYNGGVSDVTSGVASANHSAGFKLHTGSGASLTMYGTLTLTLMDASTNLWAAAGVFGRADVAGTSYCGGSKALAGTLNMIRLTTVGGSDTFDAGSVNVAYER